jgi:predicted RNA-binding Zn-ribbon protein involved in translation (DUF1610 family)
LSNGPFDELIRELKKLERGQTISVPIEADDKGYLDKECPAEACLFGFKVHAEDWKVIFRDEEVFCPRCGHVAPADQWWTQEQLAHFRRVAHRQVEATIDRALRRGAEAFNRSLPKGGFIQMSMSVSGSRPSSIIFPARSRGALEQELQCARCGARYAVLGTAFFCPSCGHNSVEQTFDASLSKAMERLDNLDIILQALTEAGLPDQAEDTCRKIVEASVEDSATAFQSLCDGLYRKLQGVAAPARNVFQRLDDGSILWKKTIDLGYEDILSPPELAELRRLFQMRHLLAHTDGIVDQDYIDRSGDPTYRVGQRIVVSTDDARRMLALVRKLSSDIRAGLS